MALAIESWSICKGRYRIHSIKAVGCHPAQIIEIENVDTGARTDLVGCWREWCSRYNVQPMMRRYANLGYA